MTTDFRSLTDRVLAAPQIQPDDVAAAATLGVTLIVNNRPDDEEPGQPDGAAIERAAMAAGIGYRAIPITHAGFSRPQIAEMAQALDMADGKVLAYCRSGTRSALLWALAAAQGGERPDAIAAAAAGAGYDVAPVRPAIDMLAGAPD